MGLNARKPVFRVSEKARLKPVSSAIETSWNSDILPETRYDTFQKANNKGTDQTAWMPSLVCPCVIPKPLKTGLH